MVFVMEIMQYADIDCKLIPHYKYMCFLLFRQCSPWFFLYSSFPYLPLPPQVYSFAMTMTMTMTMKMTMTMTMTTTMTNTGLQLWRFPPCPAMFLFSHKVLPVLSFDFTWKPSFLPSLSTDFADLHVRKTLKLLLEVTFSFSLSFSTGLPRGRTLNWIGWNILRSTVMCTEKMGTSFFSVANMLWYIIYCC